MNIEYFGTKSKGTWRAYAVDNAKERFAGFVFARSDREAISKILALGLKDHRIYKQSIPLVFFAENKARRRHNRERYAEVREKWRVARRNGLSAGYIEGDVI